jgi:hypothetical protein
MRLSLCIAVWAAVVMMACLSFSRACGGDPELDAAKRRADKLLAAPAPAVRETSSPCQKCKDKAGGCDCEGGCGCEAAAKLPPIRSVDYLRAIPVRICGSDGCRNATMGEWVDLGLDPARVADPNGWNLTPSELDRLRASRKSYVVPATRVSVVPEYHPMYYPATYGGYCAPGKG